MNIAVISFKNDKIYSFRPDTTLNRDAVDFYRPQNVSPLLVPCIYTRILKPAKSVVERFAYRYCDSFDFGIMINDASAEGMMGNYLDGSSLFKCGFRPFSSDMDQLTMTVDGQETFSTVQTAAKENFYNAIVMISARSALRAGDIVAIELSDPIPLTEEEHSVTLYYRSEKILDFKIL